MKSNLLYSEINHNECSREILYSNIIREINSEIDNISSVAAHSSNSLYSSTTLRSELNSDPDSKTLYSMDSYSKNLYSYSIHAYTLTGRHNRLTAI